MASGTGTPLTPAQITQYAENAGFTGPALTTAVAIAEAESSGYTNANGDTTLTPGGSVGLWQVNLEAHPQYSADQLQDPQANADAAFAIYQDKGDSFSSWSTYNNGAYQQFLPSAQSAAGDTANLVGIGANQSQERVAGAYNSLTNNDISTATYESLNPSVVIVKQGAAALANQPWYQDPGMVIFNARARAQATPVSFNVILTDNSTRFFLSNNVTGIPIEIQLKASLKTFNVNMKHIYFKQPSRTGFHLTLWGMQADIIEGSGTTGIFMNQLGLTDFMSVGNVTPDLIQLVTSGFAHTSSNFQQTSQAPPSINSNGAVNQEAPDVFTQVVQTQTNSLPSSFRVTAQDAFVEFLSLFKMNATVWFYNQAYNTSLIDQDQADASAWSPKLGTSSQQMHGRNNDVMTRGSVVMKLEGANYFGYFKSLSWTQDSKDPFQWHFNFVYQVERTSTMLYYPSSNSSNMASVPTPVTSVPQPTEVVTHTITFPTE
jgi:hypothetical protein